MCVFITAVLPPGTALADVQAVARKHGASFAQLESPFVQRQLLPGEIYCRATGRQCDCGTQIGAQTGSAKNAASAERGAQVSKLEKRGWSKTKIERWLTQHQQAQATRAERRSHESEGHTDWLRFLTDVQEHRLAPYVGLLAHWYEGGLSDEGFTIVDREILEGASLSAERLQRMLRDRLYEIRTR